MERVNPRELDLKDKVVCINRVAKVVKGGKRFSFSAIVVVGTGDGYVGVGLGKANEVPNAIKKAIETARKKILFVPIVNETIPYEVLGKFDSGKVILKPASAGTGIIAGGPVRIVMEMAGIHNILTKSLGSNNPHNVVKAAVAGLRQLKSPSSFTRFKDASGEN